jgi:hypothetical protein
MRIKYFETANRDVTKSPGWLKKLLLLGLLYFIPVFGWIVAQGYLYGWAREATLGTYRLMPPRIFGNEDGQLYKRGWRVFVVQLVYSLIPAFVSLGGWVVLIWVMFSLPTVQGDVDAQITMVGGLTLLYIFVVLLVSLVMMFFAWTGSIRATMYGNIKAGLQFGEVLRMLKRDFGGILRILGMFCLVTVVVSTIASVLINVVISCLTSALIAISLSANWPPASGGETVFAVSLLFVFVLLPLYYVMFVSSMYVAALSTRALGYWARGVMPDLWQAAPVGFGSWPASPASPPPDNPPPPSAIQ